MIGDFGQVGSNLAPLSKDDQVPYTDRVCGMSAPVQLEDSIKFQQGGNHAGVALRGT